MILAKLDGVSFGYDERPVLDKCSLEIVQGAITCLIGLSGAGKSTVLRLINGLRKPTGGHVFVKGVDICCMPHRDMVEFRRSVGFSFQFGALFDSLSAYENVAMPLREHTKLSDDEIERIVDAGLDSVGMLHVKEKFPAELSGGMIKRVGFARAVITNPELVLYDEPTTGLDPIITHLLTNTIIRLRKKLNGTVVVVSHDLPSIYTMADYVGLLYEGKIVAYGALNDIRNSADPLVRQFLQGSESGPIVL
jgi:phospholipid/cholesterol/gamma-HCH transport system ATP-binding protein